MKILDLKGKIRNWKWVSNKTGAEEKKHLNKR
jgi:hypothetical protein